MSRDTDSPAGADLSGTGPDALEAGWIDCGCCAGIQWGGEYPVECRDCDGTGRIYRYASGRLALWPGGPFKGQEHPDYPRGIKEIAA